MNRFSDCA